jgi:signal peptidase II
MKPGARRGLAAGILLVIAADWLSKLWVLNRVALGDTVALVEGWLYLSHRRNSGVAFSMLADLPEPGGAWLLASLGLVAVTVFAYQLRSTEDPALRVALALIVAGALGNIGDRLLHGGVTDFIFVAFFPYVFNVADAAITVGAVVFAARMLTGADRPAPVSASASTDS